MDDRLLPRPNHTGTASQLRYQEEFTMDNHLTLYGASAHSSIKPNMIAFFLFASVAIIYVYRLYLG